MPRDLGIGICVSRLDRFAGSSGDSGWAVSWNGSMCMVSHLDAQLAAAVTWEADPWEP